MLCLPQRRRGMDIKQMKNFVSQELKGLKQEHRLLSLRRNRGWDGREGEALGRCSGCLGSQGLRGRAGPQEGQMIPAVGRAAEAVSSSIVVLGGQAVCGACYSSKATVSLGYADIGACESIMKKKTKQDFQEMIKAEHCECCSLSHICCYPCPNPRSPTLCSNPWPHLSQAWAAPHLGAPHVTTVLPDRLHWGGS